MAIYQGDKQVANNYTIITNGTSKKMINAVATDTIDTTSDKYQYLLTNHTIHKVINGVDTDVSDNVCVSIIEIEEAKYDTLPDDEKNKDYVWYVY